MSRIGDVKASLTSLLRRRARGEQGAQETPINVEGMRAPTVGEVDLPYDAKQEPSFDNETTSDLETTSIVLRPGRRRSVESLVADAGPVDVAGIDLTRSTVVVPSAAPVDADSLAASGGVNSIRSYTDTSHLDTVVLNWLQGLAKPEFDARGRVDMENRLSGRKVYQLASELGNSLFTLTNLHYVDHVVKTRISGSGTGTRDSTVAVPTAWEAFWNIEPGKRKPTTSEEGSRGVYATIYSAVQSAWQAVSSLLTGNTKPTAEDPNFREDKTRYLVGELQVERRVQIDALRKALATIMGGKEGVDYFFQEQGPSLGITSTTDSVDISAAAWTEYAPAVSGLLNLSGEVLVMKDPYALLLSLPEEDRQVGMYFLDRARQAGVLPFNGDFPIANIQETDTSISAKRYGFTDKDVQKLTDERKIIPLPDLNEIGRKDRIQGLQGYLDKMETFRDTWRGL